VSRPPSKCRGRCRGVEAAVEAWGCFRGVEAAVEVFKACCQGVEVKWLSRLSACELRALRDLTLIYSIYCSRKYIAIQIIETLNQMQTPLHPVNSAVPSKLLIQQKCLLNTHQLPSSLSQTYLPIQRGLPQ
jgi:hypothetical protein